MKKKLFVICVSFLSFIVLSSNPARCRVTTLSASMTLQQEYDSNIFHEDDEEEQQWTTILLPVLTLESVGSEDVFSFIVGSDFDGDWMGQDDTIGFTWDQRRDERNFEHSLSFSGSKQLSRHFLMLLSDNFSYTDDSPRADFDPVLNTTQRFQRAGTYEQGEVVRLLFPELNYTRNDYLFVLTEIEARYAQAPLSIQEEVNRYLSNTPDNARRRSWENELSIGAEYEFALDSMLSFGYSYSTNDDRSADITEFDEHTPYVNISYRFNPRWLASVNYEFNRSLFDRSNNSRSNDTVCSLNYTLDQSDRLSLTYGYNTTSYEGDSEDIIDQTATFGWSHDFSSHTHMNASLGGNYLAREYTGDENGLEFTFGVRSAIQRGEISLGASGSMDQLKEGDSWEDVRESWSLDGGINYELMQYLNGSLNASYEKRYDWSTAGSKASYDDYEASASLEYAFSRWVIVTCSYTYNKLASYNSPVEDYDEHRLMLQLAMTKEFFRW
ncbi:MAG: outer membrane beta-barrel protein [Desulfobulbaceae bacterium]|nr:outer membrane beta-barrel protein [Desulfobulbaceae bacterium]